MVILRHDSGKVFRFDPVKSKWVEYDRGGSLHVLNHKQVEIDSNVLAHSVINEAGDLMKNNGKQYVRFQSSKISGQVLTVQDNGDIAWDDLPPIPPPATSWDPDATETLTNKTMDFNSNSFLNFESANQTMTNKTMDYNLNSFLNFPFSGPVDYHDYNNVSTPSNPSTGSGRIYVKQIDADNDGLFILIKKATGFVEVQIA